MINDLYAVPYYTYKVKNWQEKKVKMQDAMKHQTFSRSPIIHSPFDSDRANSRNYLDDFLSIFSDELQEFGTELNLNTFKVEDIWTVQYGKGDFHAVHTHGTCNLSAVLYFDYDDKEHSATHFVVGQNGIRNTTDIASPPCKEGDLVIFPSNMLHFTSPNASDKIRRVISFDIVITKKLNV